MKTLSLRQPWLWAVLHGQKSIENRRWNTFYRGPVLLHAAKGCTEEEYENAFGWMLGVFGLESSVVQSMPELNEMPRGGICGRARIVDVIAPQSADLGQLFCDCGCRKDVDARWHMHDQYGFVLADVEPLPFVPWKGALGLFDVPDDYATRAA